MKGYFKDANDKLSMGRLLAFIGTICPLVLMIPVLYGMFVNVDGWETAIGILGGIVLVALGGKTVAKHAEK